MRAMFRMAFGAATEFFRMVFHGMTAGSNMTEAGVYATNYVKGEAYKFDMVGIIERDAELQELEEQVRTLGYKGYNALKSEVSDQHLLHPPTKAQ